MKTISLGDPQVVRPMGIASADGKLLYVTTGRFGALLEIDPEAGRIVRTIPKIGQRPWGVALSRDGQKAYTANGPSGDISIVDLKSGQRGCPDRRRRQPLGHRRRTRGAGQALSGCVTCDARHARERDPHRYASDP